jgi:hypothetical protein
MGQPGMDAAVASRRLGNISRPSGPSSVARPMDPTWCARSHPTNERRRLMILLSIASFINSGNTEAIDRAAIETDMSALGRFFDTKKKAEIAAFKTPDVRNALVTGPYIHGARKRHSGMSPTTTTRAPVCITPISIKTSSHSP